MRPCLGPLALSGTLLLAALPPAAAAQPLAGVSSTRPRMLRDAEALGVLPDAGLQQKTAGDPVSDGITYGALIGAGFATSMMAVMYARCEEGCEAPARGPTFLTAAAAGGGIGAIVGWIIDAARKGRDTRVAVATTVTPHRRAVNVTVKF